MEGRTALHLDRRPRIVCQHEYRCVKDGIVTPPASPILVGPRAALWSKFVAAHDLGTDARSPVAGEGFVDTGTSARLAMHLAERASVQEPVEEPASGMSEWLFEGLSLTGA